MTMNTEVAERKDVAANPFGSSAIAARAPGSLISVEQQRAIAEVQAAMIVARANPRDPARATDLILSDCGRPALAESAMYEYSRGGTAITGPSIRLMETIARRWGNVECGVRELSRHDGFSECVAYAVDIETNFRDSKTFQVKHWRDTRQGGYQITDERDIYELVANMGARRKRACLIAIMPGDVVEAAVAQCEKTLKVKIEVTPELIEQMLGMFADYGVTRAMIEKKIQRHIDSMTPTQAVQMKKIYNSLKDGMSTAAEWFEAADAGDGAASPDKKPTGTAALSKKAAAKRAEQEKKAQAEADAKAKAEGSKGEGQDTQKQKPAQQQAPGTGEPTADEMLQSVIRTCAKVKESKDPKYADVALADAGDIARSLTGEQGTKALAAIDDARKAISGKLI
jgi:hypothetical protein